MKTICVAGTSSGVGKTTVACALLRHLPGWAALKVTRCHPDAPCPHLKACTVCSTLDRPYRLTRMTDENDSPGKDTDRLRRAGASPVWWLVVRPEALEEGLQAALAELQGAPGVVVEGTSAAAQLRADLVVMVRRRGHREVSPSASAAMPRAGAEVVLEGCESLSEIEGRCRKILEPVLRGT